MFGISWTEFLVILLVAVCVVPARYWPDVARFFARAVKYIRNLIWKITDLRIIIPFSPAKLQLYFESHKYFCIFVPQGLFIPYI